LRLKCGHHLRNENILPSVSWTARPQCAMVTLPQLAAWAAYIFSEVWFLTLVGGAVGLFTGGALGAGLGLIPAIFTFGLSIPVGAFIGGYLGLSMGAIAGCAVSLVLLAIREKKGGKGKKLKVKEVIPTKFLKRHELASVLPVAPKDYPNNLKGVFWMDQGGAFAHTDVPFTAPDLAFSFGDTDFSKLDKETRTISVNVTGPAWQWMNNKHGYKAFVVLRKIGWFYKLVFNEDYTFAQIYPCLDLGKFGTWKMPAFLLSFTMRKLKTSPEQTLSSSTLYKDRARFAQWDRESSGLMSPLIGKYGIFHYYVFQIADANHQPIQPFYDACAAHAESTTEPESHEELALYSPEGVGFVGLYKQKAAKMD